MRHFVIAHTSIANPSGCVAWGCDAETAVEAIGLYGDKHNLPAVAWAAIADSPDANVRDYYTGAKGWTRFHVHKLCK